MAVTHIETEKRINNRRLGFFLAGSDINRTFSGRSFFCGWMEQKFHADAKIVRQNQRNRCGNAKNNVNKGRIV